MLLLANWRAQTNRSSLDGTCTAWQEVLGVGAHSFAEVGHSAVAATRGAVIQQPADPIGVIFLQKGVVSPQHFLQKRGIWTQRKDDIAKTARCAI